MVGVVQVLYPCHALFMMSINATRKIFQMISIAAFFVLFVFTWLSTTTIICFRQEICQNIPRKIIIVKKKKNTKIIHENDAIQSENSPMLFIQKIILSQEWYDVCNYYHYYSISWKYTRISVCTSVLFFGIRFKVRPFGLLSGPRQAALYCNWLSMAKLSYFKIKELPGRGASQRGDQMVGLLVIRSCSAVPINVKT